VNLFVESQAQRLALYSYGMAITQRCRQTVLVFLSLLLGINGHNLRQWFKEFAYEKAQKRGEKRREIGVKEQFAMLLSWVLRLMGQAQTGATPYFVRSRLQWQAT
jgi:hypothetical protein